MNNTGVLVGGTGGYGKLGGAPGGAGAILTNHSYLNTNGHITGGQGGGGSSGGSTGGVGLYASQSVVLAGGTITGGRPGWGHRVRSVAMAATASF